MFDFVSTESQPAFPGFGPSASVVSRRYDPFNPLEPIGPSDESPRPAASDAQFPCTFTDFVFARPADKFGGNFFSHLFD